jgi:hypothetical protein
LIEYLAKTLKTMKGDYGVGSIDYLLLWGSSGVCAAKMPSVNLRQQMKGVENTQLQRDVKLFVNWRVLWKVQTYHQLVP